ncbi:hypothetical protein [Thalassomonas actiniarum]|uniref:SnoaL-like domain-containing protein n=1 Tax=Thalassomonas actiniarum TaxID=485447 RepID=A0AAF0C681_9GAMM|nr:hypothetical protein [Thalassomonas actiniarum]WDE01634.1 hypothetical protein SG35_014015 [Thalassomonas actiniarum]
MALFSKLCFAVFSVFLLGGCAGRSHPTVADIAKDYFHVYAQRSDFDVFMSFYGENAQFNDIIYGHHAKNKTEIANFMNWDNGEF